MFEIKQDADWQLFCDRVLTDVFKNVMTFPQFKDQTWFVLKSIQKESFFQNYLFNLFYIWQMCGKNMAFPMSQDDIWGVYEEVMVSGWQPDGHIWIS